MASNGSTSVQVTAYDTLKFSWTQASQSAANNQTVINWTLQLISGSAGQIISTVAKSWSVVVNGQTYSGTNSVAINNNTSRTLASGQTTITHASDGTKTFNYSFSQEFSIIFAGESIGTKSGSGVGTLNSIVRATVPTLSATSVDMGGKVTITTSASSTFTHDLAYSFAGSAYTNIQTGVTDSVEWTIPLALATSIPNATSGTVTIRCITKNNGTEIGTKTVLLTAKVPATVVPTISSVTHTEATLGIAEKAGAYVQTKSKIKVGITAEGANGSTIKSYSSSFAGKTYTGASWTSDTITTSGALFLITTVTDSRGRTASKVTEITVQSYATPKITAFTVARYSAQGAADPNGTYVWVQLAYSVTALNNKNTASAKIEYKKSTDSTWSTLDTKTSLSLDTTLKPTSVTFSTDYQYDFRVTLTDTFSSTATYNSVLPSGAVILDIKADGTGIAFFKTCTKAGVEISGELPGSAINLTTNANLNTLTTPGFYAIPTTTISGTITNKPYTTTATASVRVERTGDGKLVQIVQKADKLDGTIYERGYDSNGWGQWSVVYAGPGKLLFSGHKPMSDADTVTLDEAISQQQNGIVVVFSRYTSGTAADYYYSCHFVPKRLITAATAANQSAATVTFTMATHKFEYISAKYLKFTDTKITGDAGNTATGTSNGVTFNNNMFALRYVIGV